MTRLVVMFSISGLRQRERSDGGRTPSHRFELERPSLLEAESSTWYGQIPAKTVHCMSFLLCSRWCSSSSGRSSILIFHKDGTCRFFFACLKLYVTGTTGIQVFLWLFPFSRLVHCNFLSGTNWTGNGHVGEVVACPSAAIYCLFDSARDQYPWP